MATDDGPSVPDAGLPGASLDAEYMRRKQLREDRIRAKHPKIGGLVVALSGEPASTTAFATGAAGERATATQLEKSCADSVLFLHHRRLSGSSRRGDIDHIAIAPSGIWVIDSKRYKDKKVAVRRTGWKENRRESLFVGGRDCTKFVDGLTKQIDAVRIALTRTGINVEIHGVLCFIDAVLPMFKDLQIGALPIRGRKGTAKLLNQPGRLDQETRAALHAQLAALLPPANSSGN
ncbi:MAG: nuclease-related domain-containing protein [Candidatus Nanopelagicales bacterium]|nr:nuclease-related domain-containing protein [Candidatus Nanopelagicales bacterium]